MAEEDLPPPFRRENTHAPSSIITTEVEVSDTNHPNTQAPLSITPEAGSSLGSWQSAIHDSGNVTPSNNTGEVNTEEEPALFRPFKTDKSQTDGLPSWVGKSLTDPPSPSRTRENSELIPRRPLQAESDGEGSGNPLYRDLSGLNHVVPKTQLTHDADVANAPKHAHSPPQKPHSPPQKPPLAPQQEPRPPKISWKKGRMIGSGAFGKVFLGMDQLTGKLIAAKEFSFDPDDSEVSQRIAKLQREIQIMKKLEHENVVTYLGADRVDTNFYVFMEYIPGGSVQGLLNDCGPLQEQVASLYTAQMLTGIGFLHQSNVVHRDVKCANVLVTVEGVIKLADFGSAQHKVAGDKIKTMEGTTSWMAPEVIREEAASYSSDVWSLGCTVMEMLTGKAPWSHIGTPMSVMMQIAATGQAGNPLPPFPPDLDVSIECINFLRLCLEPDQHRRPTAASLLSHPFVMRHLEDATLAMQQQNHGGAGSGGFDPDFYQTSFSVMSYQSSFMTSMGGAPSVAPSIRRESSGAGARSMRSMSIRSAMFGITARSFGVESVEPAIEDAQRSPNSVVTEHLSQLSSFNTGSDVSHTVSSLSSQSVRSHLSDKQQASILSQVFRPHMNAPNRSPPSATVVVASHGTNSGNFTKSDSSGMVSSVNSQLPPIPSPIPMMDVPGPTSVSETHPPSAHTSNNTIGDSQPQALGLFAPKPIGVSDMRQAPSSNSGSATSLLGGAPALAKTLKPQTIAEEGYTGKVTTEQIEAELVLQCMGDDSQGGSNSGGRRNSNSAGESTSGWINVVLDHPEVMSENPQEGRFSPPLGSNSSVNYTRNRSVRDSEGEGGGLSVTTKILIVVVVLLTLLCIGLLVAVITTNASAD